MKAILSVLISAAAIAQQPMGMPARAPRPPDERYEIVAHPSPEFTQDRVMPGTRFWLLDEGNRELQVWYRPKVARGSNDTSHLWQLEVEVGLLPHVQLDVYENIIKPGPGEDVKHEGNQIELRIGFADYGEILGNPALYLEWHPRDEEDKYEIRVLLGEEVLPGVLVAVNPFYEQQVQGTQVFEWGMTAAVSAALKQGAIRLGLEGKAKFERAEGADRTEKAFLVGPNLFAKALDDRLKLMLTFFTGLTDDANRFEPIFIVGSEF